MLDLGTQSKSAKYMKAVSLSRLLCAMLRQHKSIDINLERKIPLKLSPMKPEQYQHYLSHAIKEYAKDKVTAGTWSQDEAIALSTESFTRLLPQGPDTKDNYLFSILPDEHAEPIGTLWLNVAQEKAFIYDFEIDESYRGQGYGKQSLQAAEQWALQNHLTEIGLHVFAHNQSAHHLYKKMGYVETDISMVRHLPADDPMKDVDPVTSTGLDQQLQHLIAQRETARSTQDTELLQQCLHGLKALQKEAPNNAMIHYQIGICFDNLGFTYDAIPCYKLAMTLGLPNHDLRRCFLGLGSSYRVTGQYAESLATLEKGTNQFPDYKPLQLFYALALFNTQQFDQALAQTFTTLLPDNQDPDIQYFAKGLQFYASHLDEQWSPDRYDEK
ncbi:hypothetical protein A5886_000565 [Enterococcus sp. 8G7_MSG3316]|uniref:N-acetyltransferase domain-containing protein n=1 Tax=Candidatus Enterococcus testudinis TaxID=1834191 RepID=A0A242A381_9ENTE|nr:hypothetical protein A5886_000565 [Enterococcus sp. 8G7_MSG3316]